MNVRAVIKYWLSINQSTFEKLAIKMTEVTGKKYTRGSINAKLLRGTLNVNELETIAKIFGYKIDFKEL
ncbi:hypothetical protein IJ541_10490 [bacterium]|nr:hypothetical protein [bacterium]